MRKILLYFALKYDGNYSKILNAIKNKERVTQKELLEVESKIQCRYLTIIDKEYPLSLKQIGTPPIVLFYYGDLSLLHNSLCIGMIGKRKNSQYGKNMCINLVSNMDKKDVVVSGLAIGIDGIAHQQALNHHIKTIAVLGSGIDYCYPSTNKDLYEAIKKEGLILSEYPNSLKPQPQNFIIRNRIIAALSHKIVVIEANLKSGIMNTVAYGLEFGKDICCVPSLANKNSGCNYLIKQGAKLVECIEDVYEI